MSVANVKLSLKLHRNGIPWPIMKMTKRLTAQAKRMRAARLQMPKRTSAGAYAQLDRFLKASDTEQNGERSSDGVKDVIGESASAILVR